MYQEIEYIARSETNPSERGIKSDENERFLRMEEKINEIFQNFREENSFLRNKIYDLEKDSKVAEVRNIVFTFNFCFHYLYT